MAYSRHFASASKPAPRVSIKRKPDYNDIAWMVQRDENLCCKEEARQSSKQRDSDEVAIAPVHCEEEDVVLYVATGNT